MLTKNRALGVALVGAGGIGQLHLRCIETLESRGILSIRSVADPGETPLILATRERLQPKGVSWYCDYRDLLSKSDIDAVIIAAPIPLHFPMTLACMEAGIPVYLEKPPVPLIQQLEYLCGRNQRSIVGVGFQYIDSRAVRMAKEWIVRGKLGVIRDIRIKAAWSRSDGYYQRAAWAGRMELSGEPVFDGPATNALAHVIHAATYLSSTSSGGFDLPKTVEAELYRVRNIQCYDTASLRVKMKSGVAVVAALTHATEHDIPFTIEVRGDKGWARISRNGACLESGGGVACEDDIESLSSFIECYKAFIDCVAGECSGPSTSLNDCVGYIRITNGALISSGGIHSVCPTYRGDVERGSDRFSYAYGIEDTILGAFEEGLLFSELSVPWAVRPRAVDVSDLREIDFKKYC